ncbi:MAG: ATP phosphoribosyltransferase regulatory subunit [Beijerinckiaceae bacterium]
MPTSRAALIETLLPLFAGADCARADVAVLQPASVFVDLSGEDIRRRLFLTADGDGTEWCLRPEFTIPLARDHIQAGLESAGPRDVCYAGPVFRQRSGESGEFPQAGVESYGRRDREAADAESLALALEACAAVGLDAPQVLLGDAGLLNDLMDALALADGVKRRLRRAYANGRLSSLLGDSSGPGGGDGGNYDGLLAAIEGQDPKAARAFVRDVLAIAGIEQVGGRSAGEIADRFLRQAAARGADALDERSRAIVSEFLAIEANPDAALVAVRSMARIHSLKLNDAIDRLEARNGFIAARGVDPARLTFRTRFARNLDYYTGFVFEIHDAARRDGKPVCGGGRYDGLMVALGATAPAPAIGFSMWLDRLADTQSGGAS